MSAVMIPQSAEAWAARVGLLAVGVLGALQLKIPATPEEWAAVGVIAVSSWMAPGAVKVKGIKKDGPK